MTDKQLWALVFYDETPACVRGAASFHGLRRVCAEALLAAVERGVNLSEYGTSANVIDCLVRTAKRVDRCPATIPPNS